MLLISLRPINPDSTELTQILTDGEGSFTLGLTLLSRFGYSHTVSNIVLILH